MVVYLLFSSIFMEGWRGVKQIHVYVSEMEKRTSVS